LKAAQIIEPNKPLKISEIDTPTPTGKQVLVKVKAVGVCHSDLHLWEGGYDTGDGFMKVTDRGVKFPVIPGHEVVGTVAEIGNSVDGINVGDDVLVYPWIGCGNCTTCEKGDTNLCEAPQSLGLFQDGGYAEYSLIPDYKFLAKISGIDLEGAASLACSGLTAYTAVKKAITNSPENILIVGAGGLGLMGVQIAKALSNAKIICADLTDEKLQKAKEMGADHIVNTKDSAASKNIMSICSEKGVDSIIDFVNAPPTVKLDLSIIRKRGNIVLVGLFGGAVDLPLVSIPLKAITIQGAYTGNYSDMIELIDLTKRGVIKPIVSKHYSIDDANVALEDLKNRKVVGRSVINP
jgi:propanol-preferring alcohol dehydrogenase